MSKENDRGDEQKCESCGGDTRLEDVRMTIWLGSELNVIENVPAYVCERCELQYFDPQVEEEIKALVASGFPAWRANRHIAVPVFSLREEEKPPQQAPLTEPETIY